jgi:hypothetical protein
MSGVGGIASAFASASRSCFAPVYEMIGPSAIAPIAPVTLGKPGTDR